MNVLRQQILNQYPQALITYGFETTIKRKNIGLEKTHYNDAIVISGISTISENLDEWLLIKQFRKKNVHYTKECLVREEKNRIVYKSVIAKILHIIVDSI